MSDATPQLSIVVCTHNGAATLPIALRSLGRQTLAPDRYEVVVVDDGSTDDSSAVAAAHGARVVTLAENAGLAAARNAGISAARAELVAFTDDDCEAAPGWAAGLVAALADPAVDGVSGQVVPEAQPGLMRGYLQANNPLAPLGVELLASDNPVWRLALYLRRSLLGPAGEPDEIYSVVGANMAFRRAALHAVDGFDEAFRFGGEEEDLCRRLRARPGGTRLHYAPEATVVHWFDESIRDAVRRARAYGRGNARSSLKHPDVRPIVFPFPFACAGALAVALARRSRAGVLAAVAAPLLTYPGWLRHALGRRSPAPVLYPYLQLAQEIAGMTGQVQGARAGYEPVPSRHLDPERAPVPAGGAGARK